MGAYSEACHTSKMERFVKIVNNFQLLTVFVKCSTLDVSQSSVYVSELDHHSIQSSQMEFDKSLVNIKSTDTCYGSKEHWCKLCPMENQHQNWFSRYFSCSYSFLDEELMPYVERFEYGNETKLSISMKGNIIKIFYILANQPWENILSITEKAFKMSFSYTSGKTHFLNSEIAVHNRKVLEESIVEMLKISQRIFKNKPKCIPVESPSHILRESQAYWSKIHQISDITLHLISQFYC